MAKQKAKTGTSATPKAVIAKGAANMPATKGPKVAIAALVPMPKAGALSLDAGLTALRYIAALSDDERQIEQLEAGVASNRGKAQVTLAYAIWKLAKNDASVNLAANVTGDKAEKNKLGKQVRLGLGMVHYSKTQGGKDVLVSTPEVADIMDTNTSDDDATRKRKESIRTNFSTMLSKCMKVALHAIDNDLKVDNVNGVLRLTGPAIKDHFGEASVLLNENVAQPILDKRGKPTKDLRELKAKPSFTEIMRKASEAHGKVQAARVDSRTKTVDPMKHLADLCGMLVKALEKAKLPDPMPKALADALESAYSALDKAIA
jgi:hypothetical protein